MQKVFQKRKRQRVSSGDETEDPLMNEPVERKNEEGDELCSFVRLCGKRSTKRGVEYEVEWADSWVSKSRIKVSFQLGD